jgi:hypothetical protein
VRAGYQVTNFGNSGKTMLKYGGPGDSSYWNQTTWQQAQAANSDIYTILLGTVRQSVSCLPPRSGERWEAGQAHLPLLLASPP